MKETFDINKLPKERRDALLRAEAYAKEAGIVIPSKPIPKEPLSAIKQYKPVKHKPINKKVTEYKPIPINHTKYDRLLELVYRVVTKESYGFSYAEIAEQLQEEGWGVVKGRISSRNVISSFGDKK